MVVRAVRCFTSSALGLIVWVMMKRRSCELVGILCLGVSAVACATQKSKPARSVQSPEQASSPRASIHWIDDDFERTRSDAKEHQRPLIVDFWANWCHSCINMKHTVLVHPKLTGLQDRFTWAALDTENPVNADALKRYPPLSWPTFFVIDPASGSAIARFSGAATLEQFLGFLEQSEQDFRKAKSSKSPAALLLRGDQAMQAGDRQGARSAYVGALKAAGESWPRRHDVQVLVLRSYQGEQEAPQCLSFAESALDEQGPHPSSAEFFYFAHQCLAPISDKEAAKRFVQTALLKMEGILAQHNAAMSPDDQSTLLAEMRQYAQTLGETQKARGFALVQQEILDRAAEAASSPYEASMYNWPREEVYVYLGQGESLVSVLEQSEADLPGHYDPPYRLAWLLNELGEYPRALAAAQRAYALVKGPRRERVQTLIETIQGKLPPSNGAAQ